MRFTHLLRPSLGVRHFAYRAFIVACTELADRNRVEQKVKGFFDRKGKTLWFCLCDSIVRESLHGFSLFFVIPFRM